MKNFQKQSNQQINSFPTSQFMGTQMNQSVFASPIPVMYQKQNPLIRYNSQVCSLQLQINKIQFGLQGQQQVAHQISQRPQKIQQLQKQLKTQFNYFSRQQLPQQVPVYQSTKIIQQSAMPQSNNFADDEMIEIKDWSNFAKKNKSFNLLENLELNIKARYKHIKQNNKTPVLIPAMVSLKTSDHETDQLRPGIDLICVVDNSGSMEGEKMQLVRQTLKFIRNFLNEQDRLCIIRFDDYSERLTPLLKVNQKNRNIFDKTINSIQSCGGTSIFNGMNCAFKQIKERKYQNSVTSILLLSDGLDYQADQLVKESLKDIKHIPFTIYSFGFGQDHDPSMMTNICKLRDGNFYFIQELKKLNECFADAIGGLISVVGTNINIHVECTPTMPFQTICISQTYGDAFTCLQKSRVYDIKLQQLISGVSKDFIMEILIPASMYQLTDNQRACQVLKATLTAKNLQGEIIKKESNLVLTFCNVNENFQGIIQEDEDVMINYLRVKGAKVIDDALRACEQNQNEQAKKQIANLIQYINSNKKYSEKTQYILNDLVQAKENCEAVNFNAYGKQQMYQMNNCHMNQASQPVAFSYGNQVSQTNAQFQNPYGNKQQAVCQAVASQTQKY